MKIAIRHELTFSLGTPARALAHLLLTALPSAQQKIEHWSIEMAGIKDAAQFRDGYGNKAHLVSLVKPEGQIAITVTGVVETIDRAGVIGRLDLDPVPAIFSRDTASAKADPALIEGLKRGTDIGVLHELMGRIHEAVPSHQQQAEGTKSQSQGGKPLDPAHAFIGAARALGFPARHVTGYLFGDDDVASGFHCWAEIWEDGLGWVGFDPELNLCPADRHVRLASALDAASSVPVRSYPAWTTLPREKVVVATV